MRIRRFFASRKRLKSRDVWPIDHDSGSQPPNWAGWPGGKRFAVVLTHDIETQQGLDRCRSLMRVEMELGFRSSFNFVPEGEYSVSQSLRNELVSNGFEIGVHDLKHNGKLFRSHAEFQRHAKTINSYLAEWNAFGFRGGFMLRNLDWIHDLNIEYDASTFDTDPFEPQPEGAGTIFPFWVPRPNGPVLSTDARPTPRGYIELPYTLPQDSTLFILFREQSPSVWIQKLDWIASRGGMALLITHPDYISFAGAGNPAVEYPVEHYAALLKHISARYRGEFWHGLPRELVRHCINKFAPPASSLGGFRSATRQSQTIVSSL